MIVALKLEDDALTIEDHFCGAGGSTSGALGVEGVRVVHAANHSKLAIASHSANYPEIEHSLADIPSMDPRKVPRAAVLITTPECRARSYARGRPKDDPHLFPPGDGLDERSRATMWEVPRFAEVRRYRAIVVENVPQLIDWCEPTLTGHHEHCNCGATYRRWQDEMEKLGYEHRKLFWNSAFFPPTPQSRDRIYVVLWLKGQRVPDLDHCPPIWCNECERVVDGVQTMKPHLRMPATVAKAWSKYDTVWGRYNQQYFYACPDCGARGVPAITPAATAIDWDFPAVRIGDRKEPLADNTMARIQRGLDKIVEAPLVVPLDYLTRPDDRVCRNVDRDVFQTLHGQHRAGLVVQVGGNLGRLKANGSIDREALEKSWSTVEPLRTIHGSLDRGLVVSNMAHSVPALASGQPMATVTTGNKLYALDPWVGALRKHTKPAIASSEPMPTIVCAGKKGGFQHYVASPPRAIVIANNGSEKTRYQGHARDVDADVLGTQTGGGQHSIVTLRGEGQTHPVESPMLTIATVEQHTLVGTKPDIMDCTFRMLEPSEIGRGMVMHINAHGKPYIVHGSRRDQIKQFGNAVTPPPMRRIIWGIRESVS